MISVSRSRPERAELKLLENPTAWRDHAAGFRSYPHLSSPLHHSIDCVNIRKILKIVAEALQSHER